MTESGKEKRLNQIFAEIKELNLEILSDLSQGIILYSKAQLVIGHLDADALYEYGKAYSQRKEAYASVIAYTDGTVAEKEAAAEIAVKDLRLKEWDKKAESRRWGNLFNAIGNLIIALRRDERTAMTEYQNVNDIYKEG